MASDSRTRPPRRAEASRRTPDSGADGHPGVWITVGAVILGLVAIGLLRTRSQTPAERSMAETRPAGENVTPGPTENQPPVIDSLRLLPDKPNAQSRIAVVVEAHDPDGDAVRYDVTWLRNGAKVNAPPLQVLPEEVAHRGDRIRAEVVATDGVHRIGPLRTGDVVVGNLPPVASAVTIAPAPLVAGQDAQARPVGKDPDGDRIRWRFRWERDDEHSIGDDAPILPGASVRRGDRLRVIATPWDSSGPGTPVTSDPIVVGNRSPRIVSGPPGTIEGAKIAHAVQAEDPDGDPLTYALEGKVPEGLTISAEGVLSGDFEKMTPGRYNFDIVVSDPAGDRDAQSLTIQVPDRPAQ